VIVVAEGAGSELWSEDERTRDASGNVKLPSMGARLAREIDAHFQAKRSPVTVKLIDPSYLVRSVPADASDHLLCNQLAQAAAHAGMAGRTGVMIGLVRDELVHVPIEAACSARRRLDPEGPHWQSVLAATGQPPLSG